MTSERNSSCSCRCNGVGVLPLVLAQQKGATVGHDTGGQVRKRLLGDENL